MHPHRYASDTALKQQPGHLIVNCRGICFNRKFREIADRNDVVDYVEQSGKLIRREDGRSATSTKDGPNVVRRTGNAAMKLGLDSINQRGRVAIFHRD